MGLEITLKTALNQYEIINHKTNISLWLHDVVDGVIIPGRVTVENLIAGITLGLDQVYSASDHDHDSDYAALAHNHDTAYAALAHNHDADYAALGHNHDADYAALSHNHDAAYAALSHNHSGIYVPLAQGFAFCFASWIGDGSNTREITLSGSPLIHILRALDLFEWVSSNNYTLYQWKKGYSAEFLVSISSSGISGASNQFEFVSDSSVFNLLSANINKNGCSYKLTLLGLRYQ